LFCFFFQAEDGIRDLTVTGVQTCALPISERMISWTRRPCRLLRWAASFRSLLARRRLVARYPLLFFQVRRCLPLPRFLTRPFSRSEERRVGKEGRSRWFVAVGRD